MSFETGKTMHSLKDIEEFAASSGMTPSQERVLKRLWRDIFLNDAHGSRANYEYKMFDVKVVSGRVWLTSEVGLIGDEGTMAQAYARTHRHIGIGRGGGCTITNARDMRRSLDVRYAPCKKTGYWNAAHAVTC